LILYNLTKIWLTKKPESGFNLSLAQDVNVS